MRMINQVQSVDGSWGEEDPDGSWNGVVMNNKLGEGFILFSSLINESWN